MKVQYWSDYACPYCYIGETNLRHAIGNLGWDCEFEMKAFELDPYARKDMGGDVVDLFAAKYHLSDDDANARVDSINDMAHEAGLEFDYRNVYHTNTFDAHRLTKLALKKGGKETADRVAERLYRAYFSEGLNLSDPEVLEKIGTEEGLDREEISAMLSGKDFSDDVMLDEREARNYRISSVPYFVIDDKVAVPGAMNEEQFEELLRKYFG